MQDNNLISRAAAIEELKKMVEYHSVHDVFRGELLHYTGIKAMLECLPAVDAVPVAHGRWIEVGDFIWKCSVCGAEDCYAYTWGEVKRQDDLYCPHCGAKMDGGENGAGQ